MLVFFLLYDIIDFDVKIYVIIVVKRIYFGDIVYWFKWWGRFCGIVVCVGWVVWWISDGIVVVSCYVY